MCSLTKDDLKNAVVADSIWGFKSTGKHTFSYAVDDDPNKIKDFLKSAKRGSPFVIASMSEGNIEVCVLDGSTEDFYSFGYETALAIAGCLIFGSGLTFNYFPLSSLGSVVFTDVTNDTIAFADANVAIKPSVLINLTPKMSQSNITTAKGLGITKINGKSYLCDAALDFNIIATLASYGDSLMAEPYFTRLASNASKFGFQGQDFTFKAEYTIPNSIKEFSDLNDGAIRLLNTRARSLNFGCGLVTI